MKNKIKIFLSLIIINLLIASYAISEEIKFEANSIELIDKDKKIKAKKNVKIFNENETIYSDEMEYDRSSQTIEAKGNVRVENDKDKFKIFSDELNYSKKNEKIVFNKNVKIELDSNILFNTDQVVYNKLNDEISINSFSKIKDNFGNKISSKNLKFIIDKKLLKINSVEMIDQLKNKYFFDKAIIDFKKNEIIGDGVKIDFSKGSFCFQRLDLFVESLNTVF